jgi:hypothetical protein
MAVMRHTLAIAVAACLLTGTAAASPYPGSSQALMPTQKEIGFPNLLAFKPAKKPAATFLTGYENGVSAIFEKGKTSNPIEVVITVYVYSNSADAKLAWQHACSACKTEPTLKGISLKVAAGKSNGVLTVEEVTTCGNVWLEVFAAGPESAAKLGADAGGITAKVYDRAIAHGLSSCTSK